MIEGRGDQVNKKTETEDEDKEKKRRSQRSKPPDCNTVVPADKDAIN